MSGIEHGESKDRIKVLHVDDNPDHLIITKHYLEKFEPTLQVESVSSPQEAIKIVNAFDCLVSDFQMPGMNGIELAKKIRKLKKIPIIIYTGKGSEEVAASAFEAGVDDYIRKEFECSHYQVLGKRIRMAVEKHKTEIELRESEERLKSLINNAPDTIFIYNLNGIFLDGNRRSEELTGYKTEELIGKNMLKIELIPKEYHPKILEGLDKNFRGEGYGPQNFELIRKDGKRVNVEVSTIPVQRGGKIEIIGIARDITKRIQMEEKIHRYIKDLSIVSLPE